MSKDKGSDPLQYSTTGKPLGDYTVGYGRPPKSGQIKPGERRNPKGRPKGSRNFATDAKEMLASTVPVKENGRTRHVTTQQAGLLRLREKALGGDPRALDRLIELGRSYNDEELGVGTDTPLPPGAGEELDRYFHTRRRREAAEAAAGDEKPGGGPGADEGGGDGDAAPVTGAAPGPDSAEDDDDDWLR